MWTTMARPTNKKKHLIEKYQELVWALSLQGYNNEEVGIVFNRSRSVIKRVIDKMPTGWEPKWVKRTA